MLRYGFVPSHRDGDTLVIVVSDPTDLPMIDELGDAARDAASASRSVRLRRSRRSSRRARARTRVLEEATESFQLQLLREDDAGDEQLTVDKLTADSSPVIRLVDTTIYTAIQRRASDIHIETGDDAVHVKYRIDGVLQSAMRPIDKRFHSTIISRVKVMAELDIAEKRVPQDGRFKLRLPGKTIDFRVSIMPSVHGEDAVIRILDKESISEQFHELRLDILGFPELELKRFRKYIAEPYGMVLVTGPTGSGKTTTLYAALSEIKTIEDKIVTIEDPVEYQLRGITQIPINEKKGLTFARGLRSILRHDPDKIMVGEIRDPETAQIAIQSALTGHLVFTTVHANNVLDVLGRFLNMGVEAYQFVSALNCVLAQRLVRNICVHCKRPAKVTRAMLEESAIDPDLETSGLFFEGAGCIECGGTGFKGRTAICELLDLSDQIREMILARRPIVGDQEGRARRGHAVPSRVGRRARADRDDHAARDQQGDVRRMSAETSASVATAGRAGWLSSPPPSVALEIAPSHVTALALSEAAREAVIDGYAIEPLGAGVVTASLNAPNVHDHAALVAALKAALQKVAARARRVALVIPDTTAKVSLIRFEKIPAKAQDLDQLIHWQVKKSAPFRVEDAQISWVPGVALDGGGREFVVSMARRDLVQSFERACEDAGVHAGVIDIASFSLINAQLAGPVAAGGDWLLVHAGSDYVTLAVVRGDDLVFFRNRALGAESELADLVHQTAMYHEDKLGGGGFSRVVLAGASMASAEQAERMRRGIEDRVGGRVELFDVRAIAAIRDRISASPGLLDALAAPVGILLRAHRRRTGRVA